MVGGYFREIPNENVRCKVHKCIGLFKENGHMNNVILPFAIQDGGGNLHLASIFSFSF